LVGRLPGVIELIFNTPSHHRVHHGRNPGYIDRNYGGVLIIWDRLFGTFVDEDAQNPPEYGITTPIPNNRLVTLWTHEYVDLFRDMARSASWLERVQRLWQPPEWRRDETAAGETD
ncbi:MAG: sterol desaturase family protein, partial [Marinobacter sp.]|nr:sterol desaturase family protein [Marinobacter sp.]